jgi:hypothetical protein
MANPERSPSPNRPHDAETAARGGRRAGESARGAAGKKRWVLWLLVVAIVAGAAVWGIGKMKRRAVKRPALKTEPAKGVPSEAGKTAAPPRLSAAKRAVLLKAIVELERRLVEFPPGHAEEPLPATIRRQDFQAMWETIVRAVRDAK